MPCDCELDLDRRLVRCRAWGVVTYDEAMATRRKFLSDPNFSPDFDQIYDGRDVTRIAISASDTGKLAMDAVFSAKARRALVAPSRDTYDFGRMLQTTAASTHIRISFASSAPSKRLRPGWRSKLPLQASIDNAGCVTVVMSSPLPPHQIALRQGTSPPQPLRIHTCRLKPLPPPT